MLAQQNMLALLHTFETAALHIAYSGEDERLFRGNVNALFPNAP